MLSFADPAALADAVIQRVGRRVVLALPLGLGKANHVANALVDRALADSSVDLSIFTALTLEKPRTRSELERRFLAPVSARLFDGYPPLKYAALLRSGALPPNIRVGEFFVQAGGWLGVEAAQQNYISVNYTHALRRILESGVNVVGQLVARRGDALSLSCNPDIAVDLLAARRRGQADFVVVAQVNGELPFMQGDAEVGADAVDFLLDDPACEFPLFAPPRQPIDDADYACGLHAASTVRDGGTLQLGIGSIGDAVAQGLLLRHAHNPEYRALMARLSPGGPPAFGDDGAFSTGLYGCSEMFVEAFLDLHRGGVLKRAVDGAVLHAGFFVGSRAFHRALREMADDERALFGMKPVSFVNQLYGGEEERRRARVAGRFVNTTMMATLLGEAISDTLDDGRVVSGVGGQYNFVAQAHALDGARSILIVRSTKTRDRRVGSNILWRAGRVTVPRHLRDVFVTEYGVADLRGRSDRDCVAAMLAVADSRFQPELLREAEDAGKIEKGYDIPAARRENTPEKLASLLALAREAGLLPAFPFGTDFDETERRLIPALGRLATASPRRLAALAVRGLLAAGGVDDAPLARMGLARPAGLRERVYAALLRGSLAEA